MECDNQGAHVTELPVFDPQEALRVTGNRAAIATHLLGLAMLGDKLPAEQAQAMGLIWQCVDDAELAGHVQSLAGRLAGMPSPCSRSAPMRSPVRHSSASSWRGRLSARKEVTPPSGVRPTLT